MIFSRATLVKYIFLVIVVAVTLEVHAQPFQKKNNETTAEFLNRVKPNDSASLVGDIIETNLWEKDKKIIICFYNSQEKMNATDIEPCVKAYAFVPDTDKNYTRILIDDYLQEGTDASIVSVFFANIDKDVKKELVIICKWLQQHQEVSGALYQTFFYDNLDSNMTNQKKLKPITKFNKYFKTEFDGYTEGKTVKAKYTNATQVRKKLKALGY